MTLSKWDEYFIHQAYESVVETKVTKERLYFGCHNTDGTLHMAVGLGVYPEKKLMDAYVCLRHNNTQYNLRLYRHVTDGDFNDLQIGPLKISIIEPMKRWAIELKDKGENGNESGINCSLEFEGLDEPYLARLKTAEFLQYNQPGRYSGNIRIKDQNFDVTGFIGGRDRSWRAELPESVMKPFGGHFWMLAHFPESWLFFHGFPLFDVPTPADFDGAVSDYEGNAEPIEQVLHRIEFLPDTQALASADLQLLHTNGKKRNLKIKPISRTLSFTGGGYITQGQDHGSMHIEGEQWDVSVPADIGSEQFGALGMGQQIAEFNLDGEVGVGILETSYSPDKDQEYKPTW